MADPIEWNSTFQGDDHNGRESEQFIPAVRKQALSRGMQDDDKWIAQFAAAHIGGEALRWYEWLDDETQESWKLLRRALLARYPRPDFSSLIATIPTPAAAAPLSTPSLTSLPVSTSTQPLDPNLLAQVAGNVPRRGRIKVMAWPGRTLYIGSQFSPSCAYFQVTTQPSSALVVSTERIGEKYLSIEHSYWPWLGISWRNETSKVKFGKHSKDNAKICGVRLAAPDYFSSSYVYTEGLNRPDVWRLVSDNTLSVQWDDSNVEVGLLTDTDGLFVAVNFNYFEKRALLARLVFEDIQ